MLVTEGVKASDEASHACTGDDIHRDAELLHVFDHSQVCESPCPSPGKDEPDRGTILPDRVHAGPDPGEGQGIGSRIRAGKYLRERRQGERNCEE